MPNVLWITCDEMRAQELSCYGNARLHLPGMERLAREGTLFEQCHVQMPKCVPMRGALLTGRYPHCDGLRTMSRRDFSGRNFMLLEHDTPSLLTELQAAGYRLGIAGKNHVVHADVADRIFDPLPAGRQSRQPRFVETDPGLERAYFAGRVAPDYDWEDFPDCIAVDRITAWMSQADERPFCALVDIAEPHPVYKEWPGLVDDIPLTEVPLAPRQRLANAPEPIRAWREAHGIETIGDADRRRIRRAYWSQIVFADRLVQRLLDGLDQHGLAEDTLVVLGSDHGDFAGHYGCFEKWDTALYDCITRVPLIMRLPGRIPVGQRVSGLCAGIDCAPTILELLGRRVPDWMHGASLLPQMQGAPGRELVFAQGGVEEAAVRRPGRAYRDRIPRPYHGKQETLIQHPQALLRAHMVRGERYKLIHRLSGSHELYDLQVDPDELLDRYAHPELIQQRQELEQALLRHFVRYQNDQPRIGELWA